MLYKGISISDGKQEYYLYFFKNVANEVYARFKIVGLTQKNPSQSAWIFFFCVRTVRKANCSTTSFDRRSTSFLIQADTKRCFASHKWSCGKPQMTWCFASMIWAYAQWGRALRKRIDNLALLCYNIFRSKLFTTGGAAGEGNQIITRGHFCYRRNFYRQISAIGWVRCFAHCLQRSWMGSAYRVARQLGLRRWVRASLSAWWRLWEDLRMLWEALRYFGRIKRIFQSFSSVVGKSFFAFKTRIRFFSVYYWNFPVFMLL